MHRPLIPLAAREAPDWKRPDGRTRDLRTRPLWPLPDRTVVVGPAAYIRLMSVHTTNYANAFIAVAEDCPVTHAEEPPLREPPSVARTQFDMLIAAPYRYTSDDVIYESHGKRKGLSREEFFSKGQPCFRASPLTKRYGWGVHCDSGGRIALVPAGSDRYRELTDDPALQQVRAMRSSRS